MKKLFVITVSLVAFSALADKVILKSGSYLTGESGLIQDGSLKFKSDDLGDLDIKVSTIKALDVEKKHIVQYNDNTREEKILTIKDGELWNGSSKLDVTKVKAVDPAVESWHGSVNVAYQAARGNTYENSASIIANANRRWEKDRLNLDFGYYYGENGRSGGETQKTTDRWEAEAKHDHFWQEKVYNYENLRYDRDMIQNLLGRYRIGVGVGYQWLEGRAFESTGKWSFNQELGVNWVKEEYEGENDAKESGYAALRYAHHLEYLPKWASTVSIFHNFEYLPETDDWDKYLAKADLGVSTKIIMDFDLLVKLEWDYNSQPAGDRKKDDTRYIVGLGYKW